MYYWTIVTGPLANYAVSGALHDPATEKANASILLIGLILMPAFGFARGFIVLSYSYWARRGCYNPEQITECAAGAIDPCCSGERVVRSMYTAFACFCITHLM